MTDEFEIMDYIFVLMCMIVVGILFYLIELIFDHFS